MKEITQFANGISKFSRLRRLVLFLSSKYLLKHDISRGEGGFARRAKNFWDVFFARRAKTFWGVFWGVFAFFAGSFKSKKKTLVCTDVQIKEQNVFIRTSASIRHSFSDRAEDTYGVWYS